MNKPSYKQTIAIIYTVVIFLDRLDLTIVNVTLPTVAKYFNVPFLATDWINLAFLLALAISIPISSWLSDRFGSKKIYVIAMLLFGFGSTICAFATSLNHLILLRFIQGIGGGMLIPVGMTIIYRIYDKSEYASITSYTFLPSLVAPAIAPFLGGILLDKFSWQFVFLFSGPICLILATYSYFHLKEESHQLEYQLDKAGFVLSSFLLFNILHSLSQLSQNGFSRQAIIELAALISLSWLFIQVEKKAKHPLINLRFFSCKIFVQANSIQLCFQICHFGAIFLVGLFLQAGAGFSAILAGLIMGTQAIGAMVTSRYSVSLFNKYGPKFPIVVGLLGIAILSPMLMLINSPQRLMEGIVLFFGRGLFSGLCGTPIQTISVIGFEKEEMGTVNSIFNACRQVSISLGVAISSLLLALGMHSSSLALTSPLPVDKALNVFVYGFLGIPFVAIIGILIALRIK